MKIFQIITLIFFGCILCCFQSWAQINDPTDISGLVLWTDGNDINGTGVQPADGSVVTTWADKSGSNNHLTTGSGTVTYEATGLAGGLSALRFPLNARMAVANPFAANTQNDLTVFFVNASAAGSDTFSVSLNGISTSTSATTGRYSFHTPYSNGYIYFDAVGCCTAASRLFGYMDPSLRLDTNLYTGLTDKTGGRRLFRLNGNGFQSASSARTAYVAGGIHIGDLPVGTHSYDGRFAEVVIYERGLSLSELEDVECYLMVKWKPSSAPSRCAVPPVLQANKTIDIYDPSNLGLYAVPGNDIIYKITVSHQSGSDIDSDTTFILDPIPSETTFYNGDIDDLGPETHPVRFTSVGSGLTFDYATDVGYSNGSSAPTSMADCDYVPSAGYDPAVKYICFNPSGIFQAGTPAPTFSVEFRARIE